MIRSTCLGIVFSIWLNPVFSQKKITIEDCFTLFRFYPETAQNLRLAPDSKHYLYADRYHIELVDLVSGETKSQLASSEQLEPVGYWDELQHTDDLSVLLFRSESRPVYRHSVKAAYWIFKPVDGTCTRLHESNELQLAQINPQGTKIAFVLENNLYYKDLQSGATKQITKDGVPGQILNGIPDWVYEEEFSPVNGEMLKATIWSGDGRYLAFLRLDESQVPEYALQWYQGDSYPQSTSYKYPKVGEPNATVQVYLYDTEAEYLVGRMDGLEKTDYVPRIYFDKNNQLIVSRLNRLQDTLELLQAIPGRTLRDDNGTPLIFSKLLLRETDPAYVEVHDNLTFLEDGESFMWTSEHSGFNHLYLHPMDRAGDQEIVQLTQGDFDLTYFFGVNEKAGTFYFQAATPTPMDRQIWEGYLDGSPAKLLTPEPGTHDAEFSADFQFFLHSWSDANTPERTVLRSMDGSVDQEKLNNNRLIKKRTLYGFVDKKFWDFTLEDGTQLHGWMLRPDSLEPGIKYPVLFDVYGGPGSQTVLNKYDPYLGNWHQYLVQQGVIVVSVDNRGTGGRGRDFKKCTQLQLGKLETQDQIAAAKELAKLDYIDPDRIGIWGWSYGGYLSTSCLLKGNDVFKMGMAVAPVSNWKWYDSAYTERYMHTLEENQSGYDDNAPIQFVNRLKGDNYLICHGTTDDNVHFQQSLELINALVAANKQFETCYYPNRNHGIYGDNATRHLFTKLTQFIMEKL